MDKKIKKDDDLSIQPSESLKVEKEKEEERD